MRFYCILFLLIAGLPTQVEAGVQSKTVPYTIGQSSYEGFLAWDDSFEGKRPGILVVHEWWGLNEYARSRAEQLAALGYVALAVDMYGKGKVTAWAMLVLHWVELRRTMPQKTGYVRH